MNCFGSAELLKYIVYLDNILEPPDKSLLELLLNITLYDEYNLAKPCPLCIINGIVNDRFALGTDLVKLLVSAVSAAHPGSRYHNVSFI